jgi:hypothetical protein
MDSALSGRPFDFPSTNYSQLVNKLLELSGKKSLLDPSLLDPFSVSAQFTQPICYVYRADVEDEITRPGHRIVCGKSGTGKSTLRKIILEHFTPRPKPPLIVNLSEVEIQSIGNEADVDSGKYSFLTTEQLARNIFTAYWKVLFRDDAVRIWKYPDLRQSRWWTKRLHWFYSRYTKYLPVVEDQFELMAWLNTPPPDDLFHPEIPPIELLRYLIDFVLFNPPQRGDPKGNPPENTFAGIQVLVDDLEALSAPAVDRLIRDAQLLYDCRIDSLWLTLFVDEFLIGQLMEMRGVTEEKVGFYKLPEWSPDQLRQMINLRVGIQTDQGNPGIENIIPGIDPISRKGLINAITDKSRALSSSKNAEKDAPVYTLILMRKVLSIIADKSYTENKSVSWGELEKVINDYGS